MQNFVRAGDLIKAAYAKQTNSHCGDPADIVTAIELRSTFAISVNLIVISILWLGWLLVGGSAGALEAEVRSYEMDGAPFLDPPATHAVQAMDGHFLLDLDIDHRRLYGLPASPLISLVEAEGHRILFRTVEELAQTLTLTWQPLDEQYYKRKLVWFDRESELMLQLSNLLIDDFERVYLVPNRPPAGRQDE